MSVNLSNKGQILTLLQTIHEAHHVTQAMNNAGCPNRLADDSELGISWLGPRLISVIIQDVDVIHK
jgi:hypothetical protein